MERRFLWFVLVGVGLNRLCSILPVGVYFDPFPLYELQINLQSYVYFITVHLGVIATWYGIYQLRNRLSDIFYKFIVIEIVSLIDFLLIYEHPWFHLGSYGVEFTDAKILLYAYFILKWKTSGS